jgi:hypothetical protein
MHELRYNLVVLYQKYARGAAGRLFHTNCNAWPLFSSTPEWMQLRHAASSLQQMLEAYAEFGCRDALFARHINLVENRTGACSLGRQD